MKNTVTTTFLLMLLLVGACGRDGGISPITLPGTYALTQADGKPLPVELAPNHFIESGTITLADGGSYSATTCYAADCALARYEVGSYAVSGNTVTLSATGGYSRQLTADENQLTQNGTGDFTGHTLLYVKQ